MRKKVLVITDSIWNESEVSQKSAKFVVEELENLWYCVHQVFWNLDYGIADEDLEGITVALPIVHGKYWEDGQITSFLQKKGIQVIFSDAESHALCMNKYKTKEVLSWLDFSGIGDAWWQYQLKFSWSVVVSERWQAISIPESIKKIFVKPNNWGSSVDSWIFENIADAQVLIERILQYDEALIEEYIENTRELTFAISWDYNKDIEVLGSMEVLTERAFFDYKAKYEWSGTQEIFPELEQDFRHYLENISLEIYKKLKIKTCSRIDFLLKDNILYFLEINTIPGMTAKSFLPQCVAHKGYESFWKYLEQFM